jgi:hypothetical protein
MNFRLRGSESVILMSVRAGAPYADRVEENGQVLIYEGHDCAKTSYCPHPKQIDQPKHNPGGSLTQNGLFAEAAQRYRQAEAPPEKVRVFEKILSGIWVYNGIFDLVDFWTEDSKGRKVFKFKLDLVESQDLQVSTNFVQTSEDRMIPSWVKLEVWKRDQGKCRQCGKNSGLHFDHIIPYSKGGSSKNPENIQILCSRHNLEKRDNIE